MQSASTKSWTKSECYMSLDTLRIQPGQRFFVCLLASMLMVGCTANAPCAVEVVNYDSDSGLTQRYQVTIEQLSNSGGEGGGRLSLVHLFPARANSGNGVAEETAVLFAVTDQDRKLISAERCTGSIAECSARVVVVAKRACESR